MLRSAFLDGFGGEEVEVISEGIVHFLDGSDPFALSSERLERILARHQFLQEGCLFWSEQ